MTVPDPPTPDGPRRVLEEPYLMSTGIFRSPTREEWAPHAHLEHCLIWSESGTVTIEVDDRFWLVSPGLGIWLPGGTIHRVTADSGALTSITYIRETAGEGPSAHVTGISVTAVLRELILANKTTEMADELRLRLQRLTIDLMTPVQVAPLDIRLPVTAALRAVADAIVANPGDDRTAEDWAAERNMSARTLTRGFVRETGHTLTQWRILVRIRAALIGLAAGTPVAGVARSLGYASPSTFIELFKRVTGHTPAGYFASFERRSRSNEGRPLEQA